MNRFLFFSALLLSAFGYEFIFFIMTLHLYDLSKSALNIGIFISLTFVPKLFSSLIGGLSDKLGKTKCFAFFSVLVSILLLFLSHTQEIRLIYIIWFSVSIFFTVIINTRGTLMAEIVAREHYTSGNALALSLLNTAKLLGPLIGGLIVMLLNIKLMLYFTIFIYLLAAAFASNIRIETGLTANEKSGFLKNAKKGFRFITEDKVLRLLTEVAFTWRLFLGMQLPLFVILIKTEFSATNAQYGIFMTMLGVGSIAGSLIGPSIAKHVKSFKIIALGLSLHYMSFAALGFCRNYWQSLLVIFASYMIFYITLVTIHSLRDCVTAFDIRGSVYGTVTALLTPPAILSMLAGSYFADRFNVSAVLFCAGLLALISLYLILYLGRKSVESMHSKIIITNTFLREVIKNGQSQS